MSIYLHPGKLVIWNGKEWQVTAFGRYGVRIERFGSVCIVRSEELSDIKSNGDKGPVWPLPHRRIKANLPAGASVSITGDPKMLKQTMKALLLMAQLAQQQFSK